MARRRILLILTLLLLFCLHPVPSNAFSTENRAFQLNEKGVEALNNQEYPQAIEFFKRALDILPDNSVIKTNLATTYNNYGIVLNEEGNVHYAEECLLEAIELDNENIQLKINFSNISVNSARQYYTDGDYESASYKLDRVLEIYPEHVPALLLRGQIHYQMQELLKAENLWEKAYSLDPDNNQIDKMLKKLTSEIIIETDLKKLEAYRFDIRFDKEVVDSEIFDIRYYLMEAYREIGRDFNYYPDQKIPVILYTQADFRQLLQTPDWVLGIYDGKIRLPAKKDKLLTAAFKRLIYHEYTHAVIYDLTEGNCPRWLNEGLAVYEESKILEPDLSQLKNAIVKNSLIPLDELDSVLSTNKNPRTLNLAYLESYSFVEYLLDRWNFYVIRAILENFKNGQTTEKAFSNVVYRSMKKLNSNWHDYLERTYCK